MAIIGIWRVNIHRPYQYQEVSQLRCCNRSILPDRTDQEVLPLLDFDLWLFIVYDLP